MKFRNSLMAALLAGLMMFAGAACASDSGTDTEGTVEPGAEAPAAEEPTAEETSAEEPTATST